MRLTRVVLVVLAGVSLASRPALAGFPDKPWVIAHRGASGVLPEHTLAAYAAAHAMGADVIEPDVVLTADGVAICSHDLTLGSTTDVAERFPDRARADGKRYAIDFTLAEIRTLEKLGREGRVRGRGSRVATLAEMLDLVRGLNERTGRSVGVIPEPKHPRFHRAAGLPIEPVLLETLAEAGYDSADDACVIQCFDLDALRRMRQDHGTELPLCYLIGLDLGDEPLRVAAEFCDYLGPRKTLLLRREAGGWVRTDLSARAAAIGLELTPWTFGDDETEMAFMFEDRAVAGLFTDYPDAGVAARAAAESSAEASAGEITPGPGTPRSGSAP